MKNKIKHPYQTPENFFEDFKTEMVDVLEKLPENKYIILRKYVFQFAKYAAIIVVAFLLGRFSITLNNKNPELAEIENVLRQVSEDEIIAFAIEDELFEKQ
jgi:hypothetical protein